MKAIKSQSVQILTIGMVLCTLAVKLGLDLTINTIFATAFATIVAGNKLRANLQASKGQYYDEETQTLKNARNEQQ